MERLLTKEYCTRIVSLKFEAILEEGDLVLLKLLLDEGYEDTALEYVREKGRDYDDNLSTTDLGTTYYEVAPLFIADLKKEKN